MNNSIDKPQNSGVDNVNKSYEDIEQKAEQHYPGIIELIRMHADFQKSLQLCLRLGTRTFSTTASNSSSPVF